MKILFTFIAILSTIYLTGSTVRQNKSLDAFLSNLEKHVKSINDFIRFLLIRESLSFLKRFFGWSAIVLTIIYIILSLLNLADKSIMLYVGTPWLISFYIWFSISWVIEHKNTIKQHIPKEILLVCLSPLIILILDFITNSNHFALIDDFIKREFSLLNYINFPYNDYKISWAIFYFLVSILFILIWYIVTWGFIAPVFIIVLLGVILPIYFSRFLDKMFPEIPLVGIAVILWIVSFLYLTY